MTRLARVGAAFSAACCGLLACQSIIGADFGSYSAAGDGERGATGGGVTGGSAGSASGGKGGVAQGGAAGDGSGATGQGGSNPSGGTAGASGSAGAGTGGGAGDEGGPARVVAVTGGQLHACAILEGGTLKCWGDGFFGQLGTDDNETKGDQPGELGDVLLTVPVGSGRAVTALVLGSRHTCVILDDGALRCWGSNRLGELGIGDTMHRGDAAGEMAALSDVNLGAGRTATAIGAGVNHTCAVLDDGSLKCWGDNTSGCLGLGTTEAVVGDEATETVDQLPPVDLGGLRARSVSAGGYTTCVLLTDETVKCWGRNDFGELGTGPGPDRGSSPGDMGSALPAVALGEGALAVRVGLEFACALLRSGAVKCWGLNTSGQLGLGSLDEHVDTPTESVDLGTGRTATALTLGSAHACTILDSGIVKCWGSNLSGQLGTGHGGDAIGTDPAMLGDALVNVDLGADDAVFALGTGAAHSCAVLASSRAVKCWGHNDSGELGLGDKRDRGRSTDDMGVYLPTVDLGMAP